MWNKLILTGLLLFNFAASAEVLMQAMETTNSEYQTALHLQPSAQSYSEWQKNLLYKEAPVQELRRLYTAAMAAYLQGSSVEAQKLFEKTAELRHQYHWPATARFLLFTACLRRAQLETKSYVKQSWLNVSLEIGWDFEPDPQIFPPPFVQEWQQQKSQLTWTSMHPLLSDPYLSGVLINGHFFDLKKSVPEIPRIRARMTFLSNQQQPLTIVASTEKLAERLVWKEWLVPQKCESKQHWEGNQKNKFKTVWPQICRNLDLEITKNPTSFSTSQTSSDKPKTSNRWIWWSLGALAVIYVVYEQNKQSDRSSSSSSSAHGF